jgi:glycosyltransferase involved in cell wall biosynthesis
MIETSLVRPFGINTEKHKQYWIDADVTVLICQRKTKDLIQLCLESLLRFYPDIPILVVDGDSQDESSEYLKAMENLYPNIKVWVRPNPKGGFSSHGITMHEAITDHITTKWLLAMDSDVIIERGGFLEQMIPNLADDMFGYGTLMLTSRQNYANGAPLNENDVLPYAHPSFSFYNRDLYLSMKDVQVKLVNGYYHPATFSNDGSPCVLSMIAAQNLGYRVEGFNVGDYVTHLSGSSWTTPRTIWRHDFDVPTRPFLTFIVPKNFDVNQLRDQTDQDFEIVFEHDPVEFDVIIHGYPATKAMNRVYNIRLSVRGRYIFRINLSNGLSCNAVESIKRNLSDSGINDSLVSPERKYWQEHISLLSD